MNKACKDNLTLIYYFFSFKLATSLMDKKERILRGNILMLLQIFTVL